MHDRKRLATVTLLLTLASLCAGSVFGAPCNLEPSWVFEGSQNNEHYGEFMAAADVNGDGYDDLILGSHLHDVDGLTNAGMVEVFHGSPFGPSPTADWQIVGRQASSGLGWAVDSAGDVNGDGYQDLIVGELGFDVIGSVGTEGRVRVYLGSATGLEPAPVWERIGDGEPDHLGYGVASAGDVNDDGFDDVGYADLVVGAPEVFAFSAEPPLGVPSGPGSNGMGFLYLGSSTGLDPEHAWRIEGPANGDRLGNRVSFLGDIDGDGRSNFLIAGEDYALIHRLREGRVGTCRIRPADPVESG